MSTILELLKFFGTITLIPLVFGIPFIPYYVVGFIFGDTIFTKILLGLGFAGLLFMFYIMESGNKYNPHASYNNESGDS